MMSGAPAGVMPARGAAPGAGNGVGGSAAKEPFSTPSAPSTSASASAGSSHASADSTARPAVASATDESAAIATEPAAAAVKRGVGQDHEDRDAATSTDFAALLAASGTVDAAATSTVAPPATVDATAAVPAEAALPEQFLALLSGNWAMPATADAAATGKPAPAGIVNPPTMPPATATAPVGSLPPTPAVRAAGIGSASGEPSAALAALVAGARGTAAERAGSDPGNGGADASPTLDSFALTAAAPTAAALRTGALPPAAPLALPTDPDAGFDDGFGARIAWMAGQRLGHAQIRMNPENVGPIDVRVQLDGNRVSAEFHSAHAEVRQAIEASLPRLREMLGQHGLQLGQADVGHGQSSRRGDPSATGQGRDRARETEPDPLATLPMRNTRGLLDEYA